MLTLISPKARNFIGREPTLGNVTKLVGYSANQTLAITTDGKLFGTGRNTNGQLGLGHTNNVDQYTSIYVFGVVDASAHLNCSSFRTSYGLFVMGSDLVGRFGIGGPTNPPFPDVITPRISQLNIVSSELGFTLHAVRDGSLYVSGSHQYGTFGLSSITTPQQYPVPVASGVAKVWVEPNNNSAFYLSTRGALFATGYRGQCNLGDGASLGSATRTSWIQVFTGLGATPFLYPSTGHTFLVTSAGALYVTGIGDNYALGLGNTSACTTFTNTGLLNIAKAATNGNVSFAVGRDGKLYGCGLNANGELGLGHKNAAQSWTQLAMSGVTDVALTSTAAFIIKDGDLYVSGLQTANRTNFGVPGLTSTETFTRILQGGVTSMLMTNITSQVVRNGNIWVCGLNNFGCLGIPGTVGQNIESWTVV